MEAIKLCRLDTPIIFIEARINLSRFVVTGCAAKTSATVTFPSLNLISLFAFCLEKWLNMLGTFVKDWFRYESHFVHGRDSLVDILKERGLLSESDAVQPLIGKKS